MKSPLTTCTTGCIRGELLFFPCSGATFVLVRTKLLSLSGEYLVTMAKGMKYHPSGSVQACTFGLEREILLLPNSHARLFLGRVLPLT